jgi:hypothetical protein
VNPHHLAAARRAGHRCEYCRAPEAAFNFPFDGEHIHPSSAGGSSETMNLALGCRSCNQFKSDAITATDPISGETTRLFHPRTDRWNEHFSVAVDGAITSTTPIGRATIDKLRMNSPRQLAARRLWMILRIFPGD